ncbi:MAG: hypothetical protein DRJ32_01920 [Thermoprotei archaeon]|nr:MAG: hypothetical protein DRJ32_01920 [Thermoprotei archaeon]HDD63560.1 hypothetical protein [Thermoprotei archaeon]
MALKLEEEVVNFYCQYALKLCQVSRSLAKAGRHEEAGKICGFVSSLCIKNANPVCRQEAELCKKSSILRLQGDIENAEKYCLLARRLCPRNFSIEGG